MLYVFQDSRLFIPVEVDEKTKGRKPEFAGLLHPTTTYIMLNNDVLHFDLHSPVIIEFLSLIIHVLQFVYHAAVPLLDNYN